MTNQSNNPASVAAVKFKWQKPDDGKTYDYFIPEGLELEPGDIVLIETKKGETEVRVVALKTGSDLAAKTIIRKADPAPADILPTEPASEWNF